MFRSKVKEIKTTEDLPSRKDIKKGLEDLEVSKEKSDRDNLVKLLKTHITKMPANIPEETEKKIYVGAILALYTVLPSDSLAIYVKQIFWSSDTATSGDTLKIKLLALLKIADVKQIPQAVQDECFKAVENFANTSLADADITYFKNKQDYVDKLKQYNLNEADNLNNEFFKLAASKHHHTYPKIAALIHKGCEENKLDNSIVTYNNVFRYSQGYVLRRGFLMATIMYRETCFTSIIKEDPWHVGSKQILGVSNSSKWSSDEKHFYLTHLFTHICANLPEHLPFAMNRVLPFIQALNVSIQQERDAHPQIAYLRDLIKSNLNTGIQLFVVGTVAVIVIETSMSNPMAHKLIGQAFLTLAKNVGAMNLAKITVVTSMVAPELCSFAVKTGLKKASENVAHYAGESFYFVAANSLDLANGAYNYVWRSPCLQEDKWFHKTPQIEMNSIEDGYMRIDIDPADPKKEVKIVEEQEPVRFKML